MSSTAFACLLLLFLGGGQMIFGQKKAEEIFALYLLPDNVKAGQLDRLNLKKLKPTGEPLITVADVFSYLKDTHEIRLTNDGGRAIQKLKIPRGGRPFVVFAGGEAIYTGAFWRGFSEPTFRGVAIDVSEATGEFPTLKLELDYPPLAPKNPAHDPRPDERIFKAFEKSGYLYEQLWLTGKCARIKATGKRHQSWIFTFAVVSLKKGKFAESEISFELFNDFGGGRLLQALKTTDASFGGMKAVEKFDRQKEFSLKFERQVTDTQPEIRLKDFEPK